MTFLQVGLAKRPNFIPQQLKTTWDINTICSTHKFSLLFFENPWHQQPIWTLRSAISQCLASGFSQVSIKLKRDGENHRERKLWSLPKHFCYPKKKPYHTALELWLQHKACLFLPAKPNVRLLSKATALSHPPTSHCKSSTPVEAPGKHYQD